MTLSNKRRVKLLADENIPLESIRLLKERGIDVASVIEHKTGMSDESVLELANSQKRILVTFDKDFGELVFRHKRSSSGVVLLRFVPKSPQDVARSFDNLMSLNLDLENHFTVIEKDRIRTLPNPNKQE